MIPGHDMYKFMISCIRKTSNKKLKEQLISLFGFYNDDDPYSIRKTGEEGVIIASNEYCKNITFSKVANYTPLMFIEWLWKKFSSELKSTINVTDRNNYCSIKYSNILKEYENIFITKQNDPDKVLEIGDECLKKVSSYVMCQYIITILEKYNFSIESEELNKKIILFTKNIKKSKSVLLKQDISMLNNVFSITIPTQEDLNHSINEILKIAIRYPDAVAKEKVVQNLETVLLYQNELNHYLEFYFTILELGLQNKFKVWIKKFKKSDIYVLHINNVTQIERAVRWGQTLLASII
jgi:hypothetical protein